MVSLIAAIKDIVFIGPVKNLLEIKKRRNGFAVFCGNGGSNAVIEEKSSCLDSVNNWYKLFRTASVPPVRNIYYQDPELKTI